MILFRASIILLAFAASVALSQGRAEGSTSGNHAEPEGTIGSYASPLQAIVRIGIENRIPIGIVLGSEPRLCSQAAGVKVEARELGGAFSQVLAGTGYTVKIVDGVYVFFAPDATDHETRSLNYRLDKFSAPNATFREAGSLLSGYILMLIDGAKGVAGDSPFKLSSKRFNIQVQSATIIQIANHIVSLDSRGIWVFRPNSDDKGHPTGVGPIRIYSYEENADELGQMSCSTNPSQSGRN